MKKIGIFLVCKIVVVRKVVALVHIFNFASFSYRKKKDLADKMIRNASNEKSFIKSLKLLDIAYGILSKLHGGDSQIPSDYLRLIYGQQGAKQSEQELYDDAILSYSKSIEEYHNNCDSIPSYEYDSYVNIVSGLLQCYNRNMMCEESLLLAEKTIENLRPGDDHNKLDIMFDLGQCCVYTKRHSMGIKNILEFMDFYHDKMKPEPMFDQQKFTLTVLLAESFMYQKEYSKAVEQFEIFHKLCQTAIPCKENEPGLGRVLDMFGHNSKISHTTRMTYADYHQVLVSRSYCHLANCLKELNMKNEAAKALEKCLDSYWLENVNLEGLQVDEFQYYALILMSILSYQSDQKQYLKKYFKILLLPKPKFETISLGFTKCTDEHSVLEYFKVVNDYWPKLTYASKKKIQKNWRFFKNSSLINSHARRVLLSTVQSNRPLSKVPYIIRAY